MKCIECFCVIILCLYLFYLCYVQDYSQIHGSIVLHYVSLSFLLFVFLQVKIVDVLLIKYSVCPKDVAVLTPYTAQKKLLERELTNEIKVKVRTVTESQGAYQTYENWLGQCFLLFDKCSLLVYMTCVYACFLETDCTLSSMYSAFYNSGSEFEIVILSTVRSQPAKDIENEEVVQADRHWMLENLGFITDEHQICVGITRSRLGLVIVGE